MARVPRALGPRTRRAAGGLTSTDLVPQGFTPRGGACAAAALLVLLSAGPVRADELGTTRKDRGPTPDQSVAPAGANGLRPFFGVASHLDIEIPTPAGGNKVLFGMDYLLGGPTGFAFLVGVHLGAGGRAFMIYPLAEVHYRFALPIPLVPWVGAGAGVRVAFSRGNDVNIALGLRVLAGLEYYFTPHVALGTQVVLPDIGPRLLPDRRVVGTLEWTAGPHFRF